MLHSLSEKSFFLRNDREVNRLVFKISGIFMGVLSCILAAAHFDVFKASPNMVLHVMGLLFVTEIGFFVLLKVHAKVAFVKYYGLLAMEFCLVLMIANAYFGIYISYILVPVISCLYFDRKLTRNITLIGYIGMVIGLWFRAPGAIELAYPGYTRTGWFVAFGLGYTMEYISLSAVVIAVAKRSRRYMEALHQRNERIRAIQNQIVFSFADLVESRDDSTGKHVKRTSKYVGIIANKLRADSPYAGRLSDDYIANIQFAAPLHDIGKIAIPDSILLKPGRVTAE